MRISSIWLLVLILYFPCSARAVGDWTREINSREAAQALIDGLNAGKLRDLRYGGKATTLARWLGLDVMSNIDGYWGSLEVKTTVPLFRWRFKAKLRQLLSLLGDEVRVSYVRSGKTEETPAQLESILLSGGQRMKDWAEPIAFSPEDYLYERWTIRISDAVARFRLSDGTQLELPLSAVTHLRPSSCKASLANLAAGR